MRTHSDEYIRNRKILLEKHNKCDKCGRTIGLEVHHIIPVIKGGTDSIENLEVLCDICHREVHYKTRSELTKEGIKKARKKITEPLISALDFYIKLNELLEDLSEVGEDISVADVLDIIDDCPIRGHKEIKEDKIKEYNKWIQENEDNQNK